MGAPVEGVDAKQEWRYEWITLSAVEGIVPRLPKLCFVLRAGTINQDYYTLFLNGSLPALSKGRGS